jgi:flagellar biosynthesis/type III secretory pathway protein FliH
MSDQVRKLLEELCEKATTYATSYGQMREEAFADYGNTFSRVQAQLTTKPVAVHTNEYDTGFAAGKDETYLPAYQEGFKAGERKATRLLVKHAKAMLHDAKLLEKK